MTTRAVKHRERQIGRRAVRRGGTRLGPFTTILPKPLLPIGNHAILEIVVDQLEACGFDDVVFAVGYLSHLVEAVLGDGEQSRRRPSDTTRRRSRWEPLGALATIDNLDGDSFLAMNGDVLTDARLQRLLGPAHGVREPRPSPRTSGWCKYRLRRDQLDGEAGRTRRLTGYEEKPESPSS